jgi:hypothetical protein
MGGSPAFSAPIKCDAGTRTLSKLNPQAHIQWSTQSTLRYRRYSQYSQCRLVLAYPRVRSALAPEVSGVGRAPALCLHAPRFEPRHAFLEQQQRDAEVALRARMRACVRACMDACACMYVCACARTRVRACTRARECICGRLCTLVHLCAAVRATPTGRPCAAMDGPRCGHFLPSTRGAPCDRPRGRSVVLRRLRLRRAKPMPSDRLIAAVAPTVDAAVDAVRSARTCSPVRTATTK